MSWSSWTAPHSMTEQSSRLIFIHPSNNLHPPTHWTISIHSSTHWLIFTHPSNNLHPPTHWTISIHSPTHWKIYTHPLTHRFLSPTTLPWRYAISNLMWLTQICIQDLDSVAWARCHCCSDSSMPTALQGSNIFPAKFSISCTFFFFFFYFFNFMYFVIFFAKFEISCNS